MTAERALADLIARLRAWAPSRVRYPDDLAFLEDMLADAAYEAGLLADPRVPGPPSRTRPGGTADDAKDGTP